MELLQLPREVLDLILGHLFTCSEHQDASISLPCTSKHVQSPLPSLTPLRLVCRLFHDALTPTLFHAITVRGPHRHENLSALADAPHLTPHVRDLRIALAPRDWGRPWADAIHGYPTRDRARYYLDDLGAWLAPRLRRFAHVRLLHLSTTYDGLHLAGTSRGELLMPCFDALCGAARDAAPGLACLEDIRLELPYEGGYAGFFQDTGHKLVGVSDALAAASVKLRDWQDNFTVMPIRL